MANDRDSFQDLVKEVERLKAELAEAKEETSFLMTALDSLPNPIFMKDEDARFVFFNKRYADAFGMRRRDYVGKSVLDLEYLPSEDRQRYQKEDLEMIRTSSIISYEVDFTFADEGRHPSFYWSRGILDEATGKRGLIGEIVDISKERHLRERIEVLARTDAATGLYSRTVLDQVINDLKERMKNEHTSSCLLMCDLDHFKEVNDRYGHLKGDEILTQFAEIIRTECRSEDSAIRYGGDEFLLLLHDTQPDQGRSVAERIRQRCVDEIHLPSGKAQTVSIGLTPVEGDFNRNAAISRVDQNLYKAKAAGRNRIVF